MLVPFKTFCNIDDTDKYKGGGGHGGYQDCCNGGKCSACDPGALIVSQACLDQACIYIFSLLS